MGRWLEKVKIKLNSTQVVVEVEVEVRLELGNILLGNGKAKKRMRKEVMKQPMKEILGNSVM